jgi:ABC-type uncharacterized transport system substrate-binding protein
MTSQRTQSRRHFVSVFGAAAAFTTLPFAAAGAKREPRIGVLIYGAPTRPENLALASELRKFGYVAGRNITYEVRATNDVGQLPVSAYELVRTKPDVLVCAGATSASALASATKQIPIVVTVTVDPISSGLTTSFARPSRNITGFTSSSPKLAAKRLELLAELIPGLRKVVYLSVPAGSIVAIFEKHVRSAAKALGVDVISVPMATAKDVEHAFDIVDREHSQAIMVEVNPNNVRLSAQIIDECLVRDLPSIHPWFFEVREGALMSYGPAALENHAGAASYVDRILKGAKVADLPIQEPTAIKLAINMRTARSIKIKIPNSIFVRADEVIE